MQDNRPKLIDEVTKIHSMYKETFNTPTGKKVIQDLEDKYYIDRSTSGRNENIDMFLRGMREGERTVVLYIRNMVSGKQLKKLGVKNETQPK